MRRRWGKDEVNRLWLQLFFELRWFNDQWDDAGWQLVCSWKFSNLHHWPFSWHLQVKLWKRDLTLVERRQVPWNDLSMNLQPIFLWSMAKRGHWVYIYIYLQAILLVQSWLCNHRTSNSVQDFPSYSPWDPFMVYLPRSWLILIVNVNVPWPWILWVCNLLLLL